MMLVEKENHEENVGTYKSIKQCGNIGARRWQLSRSKIE